MAEKEKKGIGIGTVLLIIMLLMVLIFGVSFILLNDLIHIGNKNIDNAIGEIQAKFSDEFSLETEKSEMTMTYDSSKTGDNYKKIWGYKIPFTAQNLKFTYTISVKAGIKDLTKAEVKVGNGSTIVITLPEVEVLNEDSDVGIIKDAVQNNNPLNQVQASELEQQKVELKKAAIDRSIEEGLLVRAKNHTEDVLNEKLEDILGEDYTIVVEWQ